MFVSWYKGHADVGFEVLTKACSMAAEAPMPW